MQKNSLSISALDTRNLFKDHAIPEIEFVLGNFYRFSCPVLVGEPVIFYVIPMGSISLILFLVILALFIIRYLTPYVYLSLERKCLADKEGNGNKLA